MSNGADNKKCESSAEQGLELKGNVTYKFENETVLITNSVVGSQTDGRLSMALPWNQWQGAWKQCIFRRTP